MRPMTQRWSEVVVEELGSSGIELELVKGNTRFTDVILDDGVNAE